MLLHNLIQISTKKHYSFKQIDVDVYFWNHGGTHQLLWNIIMIIYTHFVSFFIPAVRLLIWVALRLDNNNFSSVIKA